MGVQLLIVIVKCGIEQALFDDYLEDKPRIFNAMFPDKHRSQQLNQVFAFPVEFFFWSKSKSLQILS